MLIRNILKESGEGFDPRSLWLKVYHCLNVPGWDFQGNKDCLATQKGRKDFLKVFLLINALNARIFAVNLA